MTTDTISARRPFKQKKRIWMLWTLTAVFIIFQLIAGPGFPLDSFALTLLAQIGTLFIAFGVIGRVWSIVYVGGKKNSELVTEGPYSVTRNPLYLFSLAAILGICLVFGSLLAAAIFTLLAYLVFRYAAKQEVLDLSHLFGEKYAEYARRTPLFWPDFSLFRWGQVQVVSRKALLVTIRDALFILAMIPFSEFVEHLREIGLLPMAITVL
jgi:protein-S-isoprenylcysteine O-methyltransferase Ste14